MRKPFLTFKVHFKGSFFTNQKCFIITGEKLGYLTAFLNSKIFRFTFKEYFPELLGDTRELSKVFFETVAIKNVDDETNGQFEKIVDSIQTLKKSGGDTSKLEGEIEERLTKLYGLTQSEMEIINEANP